MGICILAKRAVLELGSSTNFVYSLQNRPLGPVFIKREKSMKKIYQIIASCYLMVLFYSRFVNRL